MGSGDFIVRNKSGVPIKVEIVEVPQLASRVDTSEIILPGASDTIFSDAIIGCNITPSFSLERMRVFEVEGSLLSLVYEQNPIDESQWVIRRTDTGDFGHTENVFEFIDIRITAAQ